MTPFFPWLVRFHFYTLFAPRTKSTPTAPRNYNLVLPHSFWRGKKGAAGKSVWLKNQWFLVTFVAFQIGYHVFDGMWVGNAKEVGLLNIFCLLSSGTHLLYQPCAILKEFEEFALFQELLVIMKPKNTCFS